MLFRKARKDDLAEVVKMIASDKLGKLREDYKDPLPTKYYKAFQAIDKDPNQELIVVENANKELIGTLQLSFIQYLTYQGGIRAQIEGVRIRDDQRGRGLGEELILWAINRAKERGAHLVQLTTDKKRPEAIRFYEKLGFKSSHEGMKLHFN
ncbi:MAG: GNAT family N-acetyltransferase [Flavobacteriaceae bacterium]|nr:GNAT family N-acetyltransferase [Flavobacteriaceae bacterium]